MSDFAGSVVLIEGMATWCPPCVTQQTQAQAALAALPADAVVYLSLEIDPRETPETLGRYADDHHFPWRFLVATPAVLRSLAESFGNLVLSPPSTPVILVRRDGSTQLAEPGIKSAARLTELVQTGR